jgi:hypothetical protein
MASGITTAGNSDPCDLPYLQTRAAAYWATIELSDAIRTAALKLNQREARWLDKLKKSVEELPDDENELIEAMLASPLAEKFVAEDYGLTRLYSRLSYAKYLI